MSLTKKKHEALVRRGKGGRHLDGGTNGVRGLYLVVVGSGNANWLFRYQLNGRPRWMGLGSARLGDGVTLNQARERARTARNQLRDGVDPLDARRGERAAKKQAVALAAARTKTFKECGNEYIRTNRDGWRNLKHAAQWTATLENYAYPLIGDLPVDVIDTGLVLKVLEQPVKAERGYPAGSLWTARRDTANRLRGRIETVLGWATVRNHRHGDNPARWRNHLENALAEKSKSAPAEHQPALPYAQLPAFMAALRKREGVGPQALEFAILTAARTSEVIGAQWSEFDLENAVWTVPAARMKAGKEHRVPLSDRAVALLEGLYREEGNAFVFIGKSGEGLSDAALNAVVKRMNADNAKAGLPQWIDPKQNSRAIVPHGFRSTFEDWGHEQTAYPKVVMDMALAHTVGDKVEAAYRRGELINKRKQLMAQWARYGGSTPAKRSATVVSLHGEAVS